MIQAWRSVWNEFVPFLEFPVVLRKGVYTTNAIESLNARFRRAVRQRAHFPTEQDRLKGPLPRRDAEAQESTRHERQDQRLEDDPQHAARHYGDRVRRQHDQLKRIDRHDRLHTETLPHQERVGVFGTHSVWLFGGDRLTGASRSTSSGLPPAARSGARRPQSAWSSTRATRALSRSAPPSSIRRPWRTDSSRRPLGGLIRSQAICRKIERPAPTRQQRGVRARGSQRCRDVRCVEATRRRPCVLPARFAASCSAWR